MINLKVRFKNPIFLAQLFLAIATPIGAYFGLTGEDMSTWAKVGETIIAAAANPYVVMLVAVSVWNALNDPTTAGIRDSEQALEYEVPRK